MSGRARQNTALRAGVKMTEETQPEVVEIDYKQQCEELQEKLNKLAAHQETLLSETKKAKKEREETAAAAAKAEREKAERDGEFERLYKTESEQRKELLQVLESERTAYKQEKIQGHAMKLAVDLANGDAQSAKLLAKFVSESLSKMADEKGTLDESVLSAVRKEFQNNADYAPLLAGSKASGGGALGNTSSTTRVDLSNLSAVDRINASRQNK